MAIYDSKTDTSKWRRYVYQRIQNLGGSAGAAALADLSDVGDATPADRNFLIGDGTEWNAEVHNQDDHGDTVIVAPAQDDAIVYNASSGKFENTPIALQAVNCVNGGDAASTFPEVSSNPWGTSGGGGGGSALTVQDGGTTLTIAGTLLNFVGFDVSEPTADEITITKQPAQSKEAFCPDYNYSRVDDDEFTVDLVNAEALFFINRRVRFDKAGTLSYGSVTAVDFNVTSANDTHVTLAMEGGDTVPTDPFDVCLVSSALSWSPIATDPFGGTAINDIAVGSAGGSEYWIAVGDNGKAFFSTDEGVTWSTCTFDNSPGTDPLNCIVYDNTNNKFWIGGSLSGTNLAGLWYSTDGESFTELSSYPMGNAAGDVCRDLSYHGVQNYLITAFFDASSGNTDTYVSSNEFVAVSGRAAGASITHVTGDETGNGPNTTWMYGSALNTFQYSSVSDATSSSYQGNASSITALEMVDTGETSVNIYIGGSGGDITSKPLSSIATADTTTFANQINDFAYSGMNNRTVCVGNGGQIGYQDTVDQFTANSWQNSASGFDPAANITCVAWSDTDGLFVACASNGQIARSTTGT